MKEIYYNLELPGDEIKARLMKKIPSTTDDIEAGEEIWIFDCGNSVIEENKNTKNLSEK